MVDMHCHIDLYKNPFEIAKQCKSHKLFVLSVTTTPKAWDGTSRLASNNPQIQTSLGLHPQLAHERFQELELFDMLLPTTKYVGEIGLDGGKGFKEYREIQLKVFRHILRSIESSGGRIMSIHSRASADAVLSELEEHHSAGVPILHWFTGNEIELRRAVKQGCWFSVGPAMLITKRGKALFKLMPKNRILPETDGPFAKLNNKPLMPWESVQISQKIAKLWSIPVPDVDIRLFENFKELMKTSDDG